MTPSPPRALGPASLVSWPFAFFRKGIKAAGPCCSLYLSVHPSVSLRLPFPPWFGGSGCPRPPLLQASRVQLAWQFCWGSGPGRRREHCQGNAASQAPLLTRLARTPWEAQEARGAAAKEGLLALGSRAGAGGKRSRVARGAEPEALPWQRAFVLMSLATREPPCFLPGSGPSPEHRENSGSTWGPAQGPTWLRSGPAAPRRCFSRKPLGEFAVLAPDRCMGTHFTIR